jgi:serine/threonine protein kinase
MNSTVFLAFDPRVRREIAVKEIEKANFGNDFPSYYREAQVMFEVEHPNIVPVQYVCDTPDKIGLAMPYFRNGSLKPKIANGPLQVRQFLKMAQGVLHGVARIHRCGFLHFDLKPSNIFFTDTNEPMVADFGQSRRATAGTVRVPRMYKWGIPPEVWDTQVGTFESDIFQLGVLFYRSINGDAVYRDQRGEILTDGDLRRKVVGGRFPDPKFFLPHVPMRLRTIIRKAIRTNPADRFRSAIDLASALGRVCPNLDWQINSLGGGAYQWRASRPGKADLEVELTQDVGSTWQARVWTSRPGERRAKRPSGFWASTLSYVDAFRHLTAVFSDLT